MAGPGNRGPAASGLESYEWMMLKADIIRYRKEGKNYAEIAILTGYEQSSVRKLVKKIIKETLDEAGAAEVRAIELARLEEITQRFWPKLIPVEADGKPKLDKDGNPIMPSGRDIQTYLQLSKAKRELVGADVPKKLQVDFGGDLEGESPEIQRLTDAVKRYTELADKIVSMGYGSGRAELSSGEDVVDAEIVEEPGDEE